MVAAALMAVPVAGFVTALSPSAAGADVTDFTGPGLVQPLDITTGPDGALWFTNETSIGRVTTAGVVTTFKTGITNSTYITAGPDGALWFTDAEDNSIGRITTSGAVTHYADPSLAAPLGITAGPDGALWFTNGGTNGNGSSIGRITTAGVITHYAGTGISGPVAITVGPDGALWFTNENNSSIGRITTSGKVTSFTDPSIANPVGITKGADGALWFTQYDSIGRITTSGTVTIPYVFPKLTIELYNITAGPDGALWFTDYVDGEIGRISTGGAVTSFAGPGIAYPRDITAGPDGALWFTNLGAGSIGRITVSTPPTTVPAAPTIGTVTAGNKFASVTFIPPANNGGTTITGYTTTCTSPDGGGTVSTSSAPSPTIVSGLLNNFAYTCAVTATNVIGTSLPSAPSNSFVPSAPPTAPDPPAITLATPARGSVKVTFTPGRSGPSPILGYGVSCTTFPGLHALAGFAFGTQSPVMVSGLTNESLYTCSAYEWNASGTSLLSSPSNKFVPSLIAHPPTAPRFPSAVPGDGRATVHWTVPANNGNSSIRDYVVTPYLGTKARAPQTLYSFTATTELVTGLTNGQTYRFKVAAENAFGTSPATSFTTSITVGAPRAPAAVKAGRSGPGALRVTFTAPTDNGAPITGYTATCSSATGGATTAKAAKAGPIVVTGLTAGKTYACTATARNSRGSGPASTPSAAVAA